MMFLQKKKKNYSLPLSKAKTFQDQTPYDWILRCSGYIDLARILENSLSNFWLNMKHNSSLTMYHMIVIKSESMFKTY